MERSKPPGTKLQEPFEHPPAQRRNGFMFPCLFLLPFISGKLADRGWSSGHLYKNKLYRLRLHTFFAAPRLGHGLHRRPQLNLLLGPPNRRCNRCNWLAVGSIPGQRVDFFFGGPINATTARQVGQTARGPTRRPPIWHGFLANRPAPGTSRAESTVQNPALQRPACHGHYNTKLHHTPLPSLPDLTGSRMYSLLYGRERG